MMASVFDVAKYILEKQSPITAWKLQKLCYYSQAWSLAWTGEPLFDEDFQAWKNGPVCPELYQAHKGLFTIHADTLLRGSSGNLTEDQKDTIDTVLKTYGAMEPYELRELTHCEAPWLDARNGIAEEAKSREVITKDAMGAFYGSL